MQALIDVILPVFLVIGAGYLLAWRGLFDGNAVDGMMRYAQSIAAPCLLFKSVASLDLSASYDPGLFLSFYTAAFISFGLGFLGAWKLLGRPAPDAVAIGFACLFSNSLLLGIPITERAYGTEALAGNFAIISIHAPLFYAFGIVAMELALNWGRISHPGALAAKALRAIVAQPLVIGILAGFAVNLSGLPLPGAAQAAVDMIARSAIPTALFGLGGVLLRYKPEGDAKAIAMVCTLSLLAHPGMTYLLGRHVFGLETPGLRSAVLTAAMAPGVNAYMFANLYGVGRRVAASAVLIATALSILTIWGWLHILP